MKPYNELTEEEKITLLKNEIVKWKDDHWHYWGIEKNDKHLFARIVLYNYCNPLPNVDKPVDPYNPPQEVIDYENKTKMQPSLEWQEDIIRVIRLLDV